MFNCVFQRMTFSDPRSYGCVFYRAICRLHSSTDSRHASAEIEKLIRSSVVRLVLWRRPYAIVWPVIERIIQSFNRVRWAWAGSHIREELRKIIPSLAYFNAATAVKTEGSVVGVVASVAHSSPHSKFWCEAHAVRLTAGGGFFFSEATTRSRSAFPQACRSGAMGRTAIALAYPKPFFVGDGEKASEPQALNCRAHTEASATLSKTALHIIEECFRRLSAVALEYPLGVIGAGYSGKHSEFSTGNGFLFHGNTRYVGNYYISRGHLYV